jgi:hypothetical protein
MKRLIAVVLGLTLIAGAGFAQAGRGGGGGGRGGGGHASSGGHAGVAGHPGMGGRVSGGPTHFTTGPMHFTTGPMHFTTGPHPGHPIGVRPPAVVVGRPIHTHRVFIGGAFVVAAPFFWYPPYPYPYYSYPYPYVAPGYGGPAYTEPPTYIEQGGAPYYYYCPDYQDYYPNVQTCPSPWMQVVPDAGAPGN